MAKKLRRTEEQEPSTELLAAIDKAGPQAQESELKKIREKISRARDLDLAIETLEAETKLRKTERWKLLNEELPALMDAAQVDDLGLPASGNLPGYDAILKPYFKAVLPPKEEPDRRETALKTLKSLKAEDLTTTEVVIEFQRGEQAKLTALRSFLRKTGIVHTIDTGVHWQTLTRFVKERFKNKRPLSQAEMEAIGAQAGKIVELKRRKEV